jgi:endo-1,4-beta-xylanase
MHFQKTTLPLFLFCLSCSAWAQTGVTLRQAAQGKFHVGVAINTSQIEDADAKEDRTITQQFDSISPENALKWERLHAKPGVYDFALADRYVDYGTKHHMYTVGHTLVWHSQVPDWVFEDAQGKPITRAALLERLHDHIFAVVGRYKGRIQAWDVVNEALNDDGSLRNSKWRQILGDDYIVQAFQWAHEADPQAELGYNDYSLENAKKRAGAIAIVKKLQAAGVKVSYVGIQGHDRLDWPNVTEETQTIEDFAQLGVKVAITELDIDVLPSAWGHTADVSLQRAADATLNPYSKALPEDVSRQLTQRYVELFRVYAEHRQTVERVTLWGLSDRDSWLNNWPVVGRTSYPLLFDRKGDPKPALLAVEDVLQK